MRVYIWDLPLRLFHWLLMVAIIVSVYTGLDGGLDAMDIHQWSGYVALLLISFRLAWGIFGSNSARFSRWPWRGLIKQWRSSSTSIGHSVSGSYASAVLLALVLVQASSGLFASDDIFYEGPLVYLASSEQVGWATSIHNLAFKLLLGMIGLHIFAIVFYARVKKRDLVSAMWFGYSRDPQLPRTDYGGYHGPLWLAGLLLLLIASGGYVLLT